MGSIFGRLTAPRAWVACLLLLATGAFSQGKLTVHLYSPWADSADRNAPPAFIDMQGSGSPIPFRENTMVAEGSDWYTISITYTGTPDQNKHHSWSFVSFIPNANFKWSGESRYSSNGTPGGPAFNLGDVFFAKNWTEVWIIPQGWGRPPIIQDYPPPKKVMFFFNPWPQAAALMKQGAAATYSAMRLPDGAAANRCGWNVHYFRDSAYTVHFKHIRTAEVFGQAGMGSAQAIDLAEAFKTADTVYVYQEFTTGGPAKVSALFPSDRIGTCGYKLAMTVRDFSREHPDFERGAHGGKPAPHFGDAGVIKDMVKPVLDPVTKKPEQGSRVFFQSDFQNWFRDKPTAADPKHRNYTTCKDLDVVKDKDGYWSYSSLHQNPAKGFFPINDFNNFNETYRNGYNDNYDPTKFAFMPDSFPKQNFHFCMEMHADFKYEKGQVFSFVGDDDVWVFIDNKLAIDLGGPHSPQSASVKLDDLGLAAGNKYNFDLFYCERSTSGSNLYIQTSIYFEQAHSVFADSVAGPDGTTWIIKERVVKGGGYCGAKGTDTTVVEAPSKLVLTGPGLTAAVELPVGVSYGGIAVNANKTRVVVDTSKVKDLAPGIYTITYTSLSTGQGNILQFVVPRRLLPQVATPTPNPAPNSRTTREPAFPVTLATATAGAAILYTVDGSNPDTVAGGATSAYDPANPPVMPNNVTTVLKARAVKAQMAPSEVLTATYERTGPPTAATPTATPPGGRILEPVAVVLATTTAGATILYTLDGTDPDTVAGGATRAFAGPVPVGATLSLKARAVAPGMDPSPVMTAAYTYTPPVAPKAAWAHDWDGDGRIEGGVVEFAADLPAAPDKLTFKIVDADGRTHEVAATLAKNEINLAAGPKHRVSVNFSTPLPFGVTSVATGSAVQVFRQESIPLLDGSVPLADSAAPVIVRAEVIPADSANPRKQVVMTFSEPVALANPADPSASLAFKRGAEEIASGRIVLVSPQPGPRDLRILVDSTSQIFPIVGDSLAIGMDGGIKDMAGNAPARKLFRVLEGVVPKPKPAKVYVTFANGRTEPGTGAGFQTASPYAVAFVPVDAQAAPLAGSTADGKCPGCRVEEGGRFAGPVIHLEIPGPAAYEFKVFTNMGEFVAGGKGAITEEDLRLLTPIHGGTKYLARLVWTGWTDKGRRAGTGAYVLASVLRTEKDMKTGAPAATEARKIRFGMLRAGL